MSLHRRATSALIQPSVPPCKGRYWAYSKENMREFTLEGRLVYSQSGMPNYKRYLDEMPGRSRGGFRRPRRPESCGPVPAQAGTSGEWETEMDRLSEAGAIAGSKACY